MSQLIALIIAIALGAIVTAIGYVFLGDAFTANSERGVALQIVNQGSQIEMAMTAHRATEAAGAFLTDYATTMTTNLVGNDYLKETLVSPVADGAAGDYSLIQDANNDVFLVIDAVELGDAVCVEIEDLAGREVTAATLTDAADDAAAAAALTTRFGCFNNSTTATQNIFVYEVE